MAHYDDILNDRDDRDDRDVVRKMVTDELNEKLAGMSLEEKVDFLINEYVKEKAEEQVRIRCNRF